MSKDPNVAKVLECLNTARAMEMQAIHQYMIQKYLVWNYDYGQLSAHLQLIAIDEMKHARRFACRVDELGGDPACEMSGKIVYKQTMQEIFNYDVDMETNTVETYSKFAEICLQAGDPTTAGLFHDIIKQEDIHLGYYKATAGHIKELGAAFLAQHAGESKNVGPIHSFVKLMEKENF